MELGGEPRLGEITDVIADADEPHDPGGVDHVAGRHRGDDGQAVEMAVLLALTKASNPYIKTTTQCGVPAPRAVRNRKTP